MQFYDAIAATFLISSYVSLQGYGARKMDGSGPYAAFRDVGTLAVDRDWRKQLLASGGKDQLLDRSGVAAGISRTE